MRVCVRISENESADIVITSVWIVVNKVYSDKSEPFESW